MEGIAVLGSSERFSKRFHLGLDMNVPGVSVLVRLHAYMGRPDGIECDGVLSCNSMGILVLVATTGSQVAPNTTRSLVPLQVAGKLIIE